MARTINVIYASIIEDKNNKASLNGLQPNADDVQTLLDDLSSPSKVAIWRLFVYIIAVAMFVHEKLWDAFKIEIAAMIEPAQYGTIPWYQKQSLLFQYGDSLEWIDNKFKYAEIDATKQIIKRAAAVENGSVVTIKVAKLSADSPIRLDPDTELPAFIQYIKDIKPAGVKTAIISYDPDEVKLTLKVYYDPLVMLSTGYSIANGNYPVLDAINNYLANVLFGGQMNTTKLIDAIQSAEGVKDVILVTAQAKSAIESNTEWHTIAPATNPNYVSIAGYFKKDPACIINYIAYV